MLEIINVSKTFNPGTPDAKQALRNLSLSIHDADFITIIGANGAGKSTLFNAIRGKFLTDTGSILLDGKDITMVPDYIRAKSIGMLFQDPMLGSAPGMTVEENMALAAGYGGWLKRTTNKDRERFKDSLSRLGMGLEDRLSQAVGLLSGGQRQALTLMMATINVPRILLLDEHTAALDPATAEKVLGLTRDIVSRNHITCLMITHNMQQALELGNRTIMMDDGRIIFDTSGKERKNLTINDFLEKFHETTGHGLNIDRMLLG